ncbi:hypothetical protein D9613_009116 [Agrocybe pediades]|uniref:Uncharacterized protein n=1 Tax=Agrocybe pediades TaxID=84607 RepID=A0A8H4R4T0_9AGAR|nr:hypothetical protein D9613_009116 [Agrocybe pediades]
MDKSASILAALDAGKLPTTQQASAYIDYVANDILPPVPSRRTNTNQAKSPTDAAAHPAASRSAKGLASDQGILGKLSDAMAMAEDALRTDEGKETATTDDLTAELSSQGKVLAGDLKELLDAYKAVIVAKNSDNILQEAIYNLSQGDLTLTDKVTGDLSQAQTQASKDLQTLTNALRTLLSSFTSSLGAESFNLLTDFLSFLRLSLASAADTIAGTASSTAETLRQVEDDVQNDKRDAIGRDKQRLREEEEGGAKVKWQHGMDTVKGAGESVIDGVNTVKENVEDVAGRTSDRASLAINKISDRAQKDPEYRQALDSLFELFQARIDALASTATKVDPTNNSKDISLSAFIVDSSGSQNDHLTKALDMIKTLVERLSGDNSIDGLLDALRRGVGALLKEAEDDKSGQQHNAEQGKGELKAWFDDALTYARQLLGEPGYSRSEKGQKQRKALRKRWISLYEGENNSEWRRAVDDIQYELGKLLDGFEQDKDLNRLKLAHIRFGQDLANGWVEVGSVAGSVGAGVKRDLEGKVKSIAGEVQGEVQDKAQQIGGQAQEVAGNVASNLNVSLPSLNPKEALEQATWFWQDLFRVYLPKIIGKLKDIPIPRTEYKDPEVEFVLENLDISSFNVQPSHVYIRNITDIDIQTSANPSTPSHTAVGTLTHVRIQAVQLSLKDVSFWYKDKNAGAMTPGEFTGLLGLTLPEKGVDVDVKIRMIPADARGKDSRKEKKHYNVIEQCSVKISDEVGLEIKESNHSVLVALFRPVVVGRVKDALEKTLSEQLRALVDYADGVAWDVGRRREVFEDTGLSSGASVLAALWSEFGRLERRAAETRIEGVDAEGNPEDEIIKTEWSATGTGIVVQQHTRIGVDQLGEGGEKRTTAFAMGAEPQILSGEKRGPLGTGSEKLTDLMQRKAQEGLDAMSQATGVDINNAIDVDVDMEDATGSAKQGAAKAADAAKRAKRSAEETAEELRDKAEGVVRDAKDTARGVVSEGRRELDGFRQAVLRKSEIEMKREGWRSQAFDL